MVKIMCSLLISYSGAVLGRVGWAITNYSNCWKFLCGLLTNMAEHYDTELITFNQIANDIIKQMDYE